MAPSIAPMFIDGRAHTPDRQTRTLHSPGDGSACGTVLLGTADDVDLAVRAARSAADRQRTTSVFERADLCRRLADAVAEHRTDLARQLTIEMGKPLHTEAVGELDAVITAFRDAADQVLSLRGDSFPVRDQAKRVSITRRPRGVYSVITPWNGPLAVPTVYYLAPGLATGNTLVWVPAPTVSGVASAFAAILHEAGLPDGALNLVTGEGPIVGDAAVRHSGVNAVAFTGSSATGHRVAEAAVGKPLQLELGGNGPTIVLPDADLDTAASAIAAGCFVNAGQICTATERILAHRDIAAPLAERLAERAAELVLGDPLDPATTMGPVHTVEVARRVHAQIDAAVAGGGRLLTGGQRLTDAPTEHYVPATVIDQVPADSDLHLSETFGPVAPVVRYGTDEELDSLIHASDFGLSGAVFSQDLERAIPLAESLPCGIVNLNEASNYWEPNIPAGGVSGTNSGHGRTGGPWSLEEMTEQQAIVLRTRERG